MLLLTEALQANRVRQVHRAEAPAGHVAAVLETAEPHRQRLRRRWWWPGFRTRATS
jgi:hypothetical protein